MRVWFVAVGAGAAVVLATVGEWGSCLICGICGGRWVAITAYALIMFILVLVLPFHRSLSLYLGKIFWPMRSESLVVVIVLSLTSELYL